MIDRVVMKITSLHGEAGRRTGRLPFGGGSTYMNFIDLDEPLLVPEVAGAVHGY